MNRRFGALGTLVLIASLTCGSAAQEEKPLYENDFEQSELDKVPGDFLVLDGQFAVKNGQGSTAFRLQVSPARKALELYRGDEVTASATYEWQPGVWTELRLQVRKVKDGEWRVEGKVWTSGGKEPPAWAVSFDEKKQPVAGKASIWGSPYATTPIRFDDLRVTPASEKP